MPDSTPPNAAPAKTANEGTSNASPAAKSPRVETSAPSTPSSKATPRIKEGISDGISEDGYKELAFVEMAFAEIFGELAEFWGLPPTQGRIYGLLFATPDSLDQASIRKRLSISLGSTSMSLQALVNWGVVTQVGRSYCAQPDLYRAVTAVLHRRERSQADRTLGQLQRLQQRLASLSDLHPELSARQKFLQNRIKHLQAIFGLGRTLIDAFVQKNPMQSIVRNMAQRAARLAPIVSRTQPYV